MGNLLNLVFGTIGDATNSVTDAIGGTGNIPGSSSLRRAMRRARMSAAEARFSGMLSPESVN
jgi:hypothetical protein